MREDDEEERTLRSTTTRDKSKMYGAVVLSKLDRGSKQHFIRGVQVSDRIHPIQ